jgi:hypothetical protein
MSETFNDLEIGRRPGSLRLLALAAVLASLCTPEPSRAQHVQHVQHAQNAQVVAGGEELLSPTGSEPDLAVDGRGGFVAVWVDIEAGDPEQLGGIRASLLPPGSRRPGRPFAVNKTVPGIQLRPDVDADEAGRFVVVWQGGIPNVDGQPSGGDGDGTGVFGRRFGAGGVRPGPEFRLSGSNAGGQYFPQVALGKDGDFGVAWVETRDNVQNVKAAHFSADGTRQGPDLKMKALGRSNNDGAGIATYPGGFAVGWGEYSDCPLIGQENGVVARFDASFQPVGEPYRLLGPVCSLSGGFGLAALEGSRAGVLAVFAGPQGYSVQRFAASGTPLGARFPISRRAICQGRQCEFVSAVALDDRGRFAVIWEVRNVGTSSNVFAQLFTWRGRPLTGRIPVNLTPSVDPSASAAALANDGTLVVAWRRRVESPALSGLFLRSFQLP